MNDDHTLVVVFDSERARFFEYKPAHGKLTPVLGEVQSGLSHDRRDIEADRSGRGFASAGGGIRHTFESEHDPRKLEKHEFVRSVAHSLEKVLESHAFGRLAVVAPVRSIGEFRSVASDRVKKMVWREVEKEFANLPDSELEKHLLPLLKSPPA